MYFWGLQYEAPSDPPPPPPPPTKTITLLRERTYEGAIPLQRFVCYTLYISGTCLSALVSFWKNRDKLYLRGGILSYKERASLRKRACRMLWIRYKSLLKDQEECEKSTTSLKAAIAALPSKSSVHQTSRATIRRVWMNTTSGATPDQNVGSDHQAWLDEQNFGSDGQSPPPPPPPPPRLTPTLYQNTTRYRCDALPTEL